MEIEKWRWVFRSGIAPELTDAHLAALRDGIRADDERLIQGCTVEPYPIASPDYTLAQCACPLGYGVLASGSATVQEVMEFAEWLMLEANLRLRDTEPAACRHFLNAVDEHPRSWLQAELLPEVELEINRREQLPTPATGSPVGC